MKDIDVSIIVNFFIGNNGSLIWSGGIVVSPVSYHLSVPEMMNLVLKQNNSKGVGPGQQVGE